MAEITASCGTKVLVDESDAGKIRGWTWTVRRRGSKVSYVYNHKLGMIHRHLLELTVEDGLVDHIDGNPLNNQRSNLRVTSKAENAVNSNKKSGLYTSKHKGVSYDRKRKLYRARVAGLDMGSFPSEIDAANAYNFYVKYFYEIPKLNDVQESEWYSRKVYRGDSYFKGVARARDRWSASVWFQGKAEHVGVFDTEYDAAVAYNTAALEKGLPLSSLNAVDTIGNVLIPPCEFKAKRKLTKGGR